MERIREILEMGGKALILIAGSCYVIGLIVVNIHLSQYGFYSLSLLQLNYITAGIWALLPILLVVFIIVYIVDTFFTEWEREQPSTLKWKTVVVGIGIIFAGTGVFGLLSMLARALGLTFGWNWVLVSGAGAGAAFFLMITVFTIASPKSFSTVKATFNTLQIIFLTAVIFIAYVAYFARALYKELPGALGGGRPHLIRLVVEPEAKPFLENAGLQFPNEPNKTEPLELIVSTDKEYVLLSNPSKNAVSVPNGLVKAVIFEKK
jgi:hypothetical protein